MLQIYNTLTKQKEIFKPIVPGKVRMYVCGVTVYDYCHLGHARTYLVFDTVARYLRYRGFDVTYVRNITDIDDKIIHRAQDHKKPIEFITEYFTKAMHEDEKKLNFGAFNSEPKATEYVSQMVKLIENLISKGYAYVTEQGDVYYDIQKFKSYGHLSQRILEDLQAGSRVDINQAKQNPLDFVLWKSAKPKEPHWESPWGIGRPGWHTECSAMALEELGETIDIHGGGSDLKFPHHENERAQSEAVTGKTFVNTWMHVGFLQVNKEKMAKSLGNFLTIRDFFKEYNPEILRYFVLASHYRSPVDFSVETIEAAKNPLERLYTALRGLFDTSLNGIDNVDNDGQVPDNTDFEKRFQEAMDDDFNTPVAFSVLFELVREINREKLTNLKNAQSLGLLLKKLGNILGLLYQDPAVFLHSADKLEVDPNVIEELIQLRDKARKEKDWATSDEVRKTLTDMGVTLEDTPTGTLWRKG